MARPKKNICLFCEKVCNSKSDLFNHNLCHIRERPYFCVTCNAEFSQKPHWLDHVRRDFCETRQYVCSFCQEIFNSKKKRWQHLMTHVTGKLCCCSNCSVKSPSDELLRSKMRTVPWHLECPFCKKGFAHIVILERHMSTHTREKPYFCTECPKAFGTQSCMRVHLKSHSNKIERPFECGICSKRFQYKQHLDSHTTVHIGDRPFACRVCGKRFKLSSTCKHHEKTHRNTRDYKCDQCPLTFKSNPDLKQHHQRVHMEKTLKCSVCDKKFSTKALLKYHMTDHAKRQAHKCHICDTDYVWKCDLDRHIASKHPYEKVVTKNPNRICTSAPDTANVGNLCVFCEKSFGRTQPFFSHLMAHVSERPYFCEKCHSEFSQISHLHYHVRTNKCFKSIQHLCPFCQVGFSNKLKRFRHFNTHVSGKICCCKQCTGGDEIDKQIRIQMRPMGTRVECIFCDQQFSPGRQLNTHISSHIQEKPYFCGQCNNEFGQSANLRSHVLRTHSKTRVKPFSCDVCNRRFQTKQGLDLHTTVHIQDRPFSCPTCGKRFKSVASCKTHEKVHSTVREFQCDICARAFKWQSALAMHNRRFHMEKKINCEICSEKFSTMENLKTHMSHHTGELAHVCQVCNMRFGWKGNLKRHIAYKHTPKNKVGGLEEIEQLLNM